MNRAPYLSEQDVKVQIKTPAVLKAFEMCRWEQLPQEVKDQYNARDSFYQIYPDLANEIFNDGLESGKESGKESVQIEQAKRWFHEKKFSPDQISELLNRSESWVHEVLELSTKS